MSMTNDEESFNQNHMAQELDSSSQQQENKKKKKSHGNRKLQRNRRKLRDQGMSSHTIAQLISSWIDLSQPKADKVTQKTGETIKPTANETVFHPPKPIKKKKKNRKNNQ